LLAGYDPYFRAACIRCGHVHRLTLTANGSLVTVVVSVRLHR